ncbi:MAG: hypothetical protein WC959_02335 [Kiritimatiellales bacterium]
MKKRWLISMIATAVAGYIQAGIILNFTANGTDAGPTAQGWTASGTTLRYYTNETFGSVSYNAWVFQSVAGDTGDYFLNPGIANTNAMRTDGWTVTYVSRTALAPSQGYHRLRLRDGSGYFDLHFVAGSTSSIANGLYLANAGTGYQLIQSLDLSGGYNTIQLTYEPLIAGSLNDNDVIKIWINGGEALSTTRAACNLGATGIIRAEFADAATGGAGLFAVNQFTLETGINVIPEPSTLGLFSISVLTILGIRLRLKNVMK